MSFMLMTFHINEPMFVHFYFGSQFFQLMLRSEKCGKFFTCSRIFHPTKISSVRYRKLFCGELEETSIHFCLVEKLLSKLLKILRKT